MIYGVNLGAGSGWKAPHWHGIDKIDGDFLDAKSVFPFDDDSIRWIYSSHFFEHVDDDTADNLFAESYRILKPGGILRIVVPDFGLFIQKYKENDENWYRNIIKAKARDDWSKYGVTDCLSNLLLHWVANHDFNGPKGFYRGPPIGMSEDDVRHKATTCDTEEFCEWAQGLIPDDPRVLGNHINWWNVEKFQIFFKVVGFRTIYHCDYMKSDTKIFLKSNMFDSWKPNRKDYGLYMETKK